MLNFKHSKTDTPHEDLCKLLSIDSIIIPKIKLSVVIEEANKDNKEVNDLSDEDEKNRRRKKEDSEVNDKDEENENEGEGESPKEKGSPIKYGFD